MQCDHEFVQDYEGRAPCIGYSFRQAIKNSPNLLLAGIRFVVTKRALDFSNLFWAENNILGPTIQNINKEIGDFTLLILG